MGRITSLEQLRRTLPEPRATTKAKILPAIDAQGRAFIARAPFLFLATVDAAGTVEVSPKGDGPGFVQIEDDRTLVLPERAGNNLAFGLQNIIATEQAALIFVLPGTSEMFRVSGRADILDDADLTARLGTADRPALLAIRLHVKHCYFHCARAALRSKLWQPQSWTEKMHVSFGSIIAPRVGGDAAMAQQIDASVDEGMKSRLWKNA